MKIPNFKCNFCGQVYDEGLCCNNPFGVTHHFGYESDYDGETLDFDLCPECADKLVTYIIENSKVKCMTE